MISPFLFPFSLMTFKITAVSSSSICCNNFITTHHFFQQLSGFTFCSALALTLDATESKFSKEISFKFSFEGLRTFFFPPFFLMQRHGIPLFQLQFLKENYQLKLIFLFLMFSIFYAVILKHLMCLTVILIAIFLAIFLSGPLSRVTSPAFEQTGVSKLLSISF